MSVRVSSWVWEHAPAKGNQLLVMLALADVADDQGVAWPSQSHLAAKTRLSLATVKRVMKSLREVGAIVSDASLGRSNVYRIVMDSASGGGSLGDPVGAQSDTGVNLIPSSLLSQGVAHSSELGGSSTVSYRTVIDPSGTRQGDAGDEFDVDVPKGTRSAQVLPRPFFLSGRDREWAAEHAPSVSVDVVTSDFVAYWREGEGRGKRKKNWSLTWRTWLRREHARNVERGWKPADEDERKVIRGGRVV